MNKQGKGKIEWTGYSWNPVTGCKHGCPYCYARRLYTRFGWSFEPTFHTERLNAPAQLKEAAMIFVCSTADLFGNWVPEDWIRLVIKETERSPQHTYQFLTKNPNRYKFFDFPKNCWLGTTAESGEQEARILTLKLATPHDSLRFVSVEPILGEFKNPEVFRGISWVIIGGMTGAGAVKVKREWVESVLSACDKFSVPVFIKPKALAGLGLTMRSEFPKKEAKFKEG